MNVITESFEGFHLRDQNASWQVIIKTKEGKDYCRETLDGSKSLEEVRLWAETTVNLNPHFGGADIQRW